MTDHLLRNAAVRPDTIRDVAVVDGRIATPDALGPGHVVVDLDGRPTVAGLVDNHVHLAATAAARESVDVSPGRLADGGGLGEVLRAARRDRPDGWLRAVGYDPNSDGSIDRDVLDAAGAGPVRVQDRSGVTWTLDSAGLALIGVDDGPDGPDGVEVDRGRPTGRLVRLDPWLRQRLPARLPDVAAVGRRLAERGVTTVVDATVSNGADELAMLAASGIPQRIVAMTGAVEVESVPGEVALGPVKVVLDDDRLPGLDELSALVARAHGAGRAVAVHCVSAAQLVLAIAAGLRGGDRIEHGSVVLDEHVPLLRRSRVTVVAQPGLILTRGDRYLRDTDPDERAGLHRVGGLLADAVPVVFGSDAPYGPLDPWAHVAGAVDRVTAGGTCLRPDDRVPFDVALACAQSSPGATTGPAWPGSGAAADITVLDVGWSELTADPAAATVHSTWVAGNPVFGGP